MRERVAITGIGVVSPVGSGRGRFWHALGEGRSGIRTITLFDVSQFPVRIGGQVDDVDAAEICAAFPRAVGERDRKVLLGLAAAREAIADAGLSSGHLRSAQLHVGVGLEAFFLDDLMPIVGAADPAAALVREATGNSGNASPSASRCCGAGVPPASVEQAGRLHHNGGARLQTPLDRLGELIGEHYGILGGRFTNCSACAAGAQAIGAAFRAIGDGATTLAIAGAADSMLNPLGLGGFSLLRVLSAENDHPTEACRPFDATRIGTVLGEGAAFLILEPLDRAIGRGARIYAEVLGYGSSMDAFRVSDPEPTGRGAVLAMTRAMRDAGLSAADIDCVSAHGTGTPKNDIVETSAIKEALGERARQVHIHAIKSMTGHMIAASGAAEAAAAAMTILHRMIPPTINLRSPDPLCDLDYVPNRARAFGGRTVLSNSFGFGGQNATLIFGRTDP